jgi:phosphoglycerate dehydrogenase-like enzyme
MKNKAAFVCGDNRINEVYRDTMPKLLAEPKLDFLDEIINSHNIEKYKDQAAECRYIFTTWGMVSGLSEYFKNCEVVFYGAGSVQYFAREYLEKGIKVSSSWVANGIPVAEVAVSKIILACKGHFKIMRTLKSKKDWNGNRQIITENYRGNYNQKIGILGAGTIGSRVIEYLKRLEINAGILVYDPYYTEQKAAAAGVKKASLEEIFSSCTVISCHVANLPSTQKMLNKNHFGLLRNYATFINTGRGAQIVENDLIEAAKNNPTLTVLLDVTEPEPPEEGSAFYDLENVILTPHIAGCTGDEILRMAEYMHKEYKLYESEKKLAYEVTLDMLEYMA